jgi:hypothetical protein
VRLPEVLAVGFTGHRKLTDEARCRKWIEDFLAQQKAKETRTLCGVSSVAAGGDLLFAESCLGLGIPLRVLLPLAREEFRKDFDEAAWARAEQVMRSAISVETVGSDADRKERYYECGLETVQQSQWLLALWNGQPAQGLGGTEEIVKFAQQMGRPVVWMQSETGALESYNRPEDDLKHAAQTRHDKELEFLNRLPWLGEGSTPVSPTELATAWLEKLDRNAVLVAPQVRRLAAFPILCTAVAAFLSAAAPRMHWPGLLSMPVWLAAGAILGLLASVLPAMLRLGRRQALWVRIRTAAEVSRAVLAQWHMPSRYLAAGPEILPELSGMLRSLDLLKSQAAPAEPLPVGEFVGEYLQKRLLDQKDYFQRQSAKAAVKAARYRLLSKVCIVTAISLTVGTFAAGFFVRPGTVEEAAWVALISSALFQLATVAGALLVVHDCDRRQRRYVELHRSLAGWETELRALRTWPPVIQVVGRIERALLVELIEWRALLQNRKMPRN